MCGIAGFLIKTNNNASKNLLDLRAMLQALELRGPDDTGTYLNPPVYLGMQRLAIIDRATGRQPMIDPTTGMVIVYNGELYNYQELRQDLIQLGHQFSSNSDTEVILKAYLHWQAGCLQKFNGMFAFAIWDTKQQQLFLARDHTGQKPLYYINTAKLFAFASDLRSLIAHSLIKAELNQSKIAEYLQHRHVPGPETLLKHIFCLPAAHQAILKNQQQLNIKPYWRFRFHTDSQLSLDSFNEQLSTLWPQVIKRHLVSEVAIGGFLSGGIDSSLITMAAAKQIDGFQTFSISFTDKNFDESNYATQVAQQFNCKHTTIPFNGSFETLIKHWLTAFDQPLADPATFPLLLLARAAKKQITVALAGDGADELFAGYQRYLSMLWSSKLRKWPASARQLMCSIFSISARLLNVNSHAYRWLTAASRRLELMQMQFAHEYLSQFHLFRNHEINALINPTLKNSNEPVTPLTLADEPDFKLGLPTSQLLHAMLEYDMQHWLPEQMLVKSDRASMAYSLELRLPFLDREIIELAAGLSSQLLINAKQTKYALRQFNANYFPTTISQRKKQGFAVPLDHWIRQQSGYFSESYLQGCINNKDIFNPRLLNMYWQQHISGQANHGEKLLTLLLFFIWREHLSLH